MQSNKRRGYLKPATEREKNDNCLWKPQRSYTSQPNIISTHRTFDCLTLFKEREEKKKAMLQDIVDCDGSGMPVHVLFNLVFFLLHSGFVNRYSSVHVLCCSCACLVDRRPSRLHVTIEQRFIMFVADMDFIQSYFASMYLHL